MSGFFSGMHDNVIKDESLTMNEDIGNELRKLSGQLEFEKEASFYALDMV